MTQSNQVVPVEPTEEMIDAMDEVIAKAYNPANAKQKYKARHAYAAALAAAPQREEVSSVQELIRDICEMEEPPEDDGRVVRVNLDWLEQKMEEALSAKAQTAQQKGSDCSMCKGSGEYEATDTSSGPDGETYTVNCPECSGTGIGGYAVHAPTEDGVEALRCDKCDGFGTQQQGKEPMIAGPAERSLYCAQRIMSLIKQEHVGGDVQLQAKIQCQIMELVDCYVDAYKNMREWAESNGLDTTCYNNGKPAQQQGEPVLYMARNLHNKSYATHQSKTECELFLARSGLKNDGIEAEVIALYTQPPTADAEFNAGVEATRAVLANIADSLEEGSQSRFALLAAKTNILSLKRPTDMVTMTKAELEALRTALIRGRTLAMASLTKARLTDDFIAQANRDADLIEVAEAIVSHAMEGK